MPTSIQIADVSYLLDTFFSQGHPHRVAERRLHRGPDDHRSRGGRGPEEGRAGDAAERRHEWHGRHGFLMRWPGRSGTGPRQRGPVPATTDIKAPRTGPSPAAMPGFCYARAAAVS